LRKAAILEKQANPLAKKSQLSNFLEVEILAFGHNPGVPVTFKHNKKKYKGCFQKSKNGNVYVTSKSEIIVTLIEIQRL
jgi:hypothetical protein